MTEKLKALLESDFLLDFVANTLPKCPHCGAEYDISAHEAWHLYGEDGDENDVRCGSCEMPFKVKTHVEYTFNTDEQDDDPVSAVSEPTRPLEEK